MHSLHQSGVDLGLRFWKAPNASLIEPDELANDVKFPNGRIKVFVVVMDQFME